MSAITLVFSLLATSVSPIPDSHDVILHRVSSVPEFQNISCSECIHTIDIVKNETAFLAKVASGVEYICGKIYGPAAHECVNITDDLRKSLDYLSQHNSTTVCQHLHYC